MKALTLIEPGRFHYGDVDRPAPDKEEVLIRVGACGICGSDIHAWTAAAVDAFHRSSWGTSSRAQWKQ